jgi:signal transduction histidine kinase
MIFYFFNIVTITSISFFLLLKFVNDNEKFKELLKIKNHELSKEKQRAVKTLEELKISQSQLIQAEKMASLGELTAGIAHEIQNPLNFVNNFSEINKELLEELVAEIEKGNYDEVKALSVDIRSNEEKIAHHGKRADGIVKGMLQHSRTSSGVKEWSDINEIADEYLRLAYHGLRAKDKSFNAEFRVELDETLPKIKIIPQDIGRVLLNMVNNAFFAVSVQSRKGIPDYVPTVIVTTRKLKNAVEIRVKDNGAGIPGNLLDKIFQPFFTTKPTGEGTGLGLSLSYDIISKGHNGKLDVETREGIGTEFIIELPL